MDEKTSRMLAAAEPLKVVGGVLGEVEVMPQSESGLTYRLDNLKPEINVFLYKWLPPKTTISEMETIGLSIFARIHEEWIEKMGLR